MCANDQGKFWEMHNKMFGDQAKLDIPSLKASATSIGMDGTKFSQCLDTGKFQAVVKEDQAAGAKLGVSGTPAFFINGVMLSGAQPIEEFKKVIDAELSGGKTQG